MVCCMAPLCKVPAREVNCEFQRIRFQNSVFKALQRLQNLKFFEAFVVGQGPPKQGCRCSRAMILDSSPFQRDI